MPGRCYVQALLNPGVRVSSVVWVQTKGLDYSKLSSLSVSKTRQKAEREQ